MDTTLARCSVMPGKDNASVSPYLRKPVRNYQDATREQAKRPKQPTPKKDSLKPGDPCKAEPSSKWDDRT